MIPLSVLDLAPIVEGGDVAQALRNSRDLAVNAEKFGYNRFWLAEHHNMPGIASAATALTIMNAAEATTRIRVGAGGIMLPNHAPFVIAEQFGTLAALYPGRIDLGLGRAPGGDPLVARALRRTLMGGEDRFPQDVLELKALLAPARPDQSVRAVPGEASNVPLWILGSSTFGAQLAAALGLPFAFASHFAPTQMMQAIDIYRRAFQPSEQLQKPYVMLGFNIFAAPTDDEARYIATSMLQAFAALREGRPRKLQPPDPALISALDGIAASPLGNILECSAIGGPERVKAAIEAFAARTDADELILASHIYDHAARARSYAIAAEACAITRR